MKKHKIIFWITTTIIFLFEGVMSAYYFNRPESKAGMIHFGYPEYFRVSLVIFKILGALALMIPVSKRIKEWAYAGFTFNFIFASITNGAVDGFGFNAIFPLIFIGILMLSYTSYHKLTDSQA